MRKISRLGDSWVYLSLDAMRVHTITFLITACSLAACQAPPLRPPPEEEAGYRNAAPVIAAIDTYHRDHGHYPARLNQLVPHYLPRVHQIDASRSWEDQTGRFQYYPQRDRYGLDFTYYSSSQSHMMCYDSQTKKWEHVVID
ncbi:MAG TPA: hypothetical protein VH188_06600 [Chthoniobacterales bacterium]|nr:hypothetical protein [Chthoniobacterales bacterium]